MSNIRNYEVAKPNGCSYSTLNSYNQNYSLSTQNVGAPVVSGARSNQVVIVPSYGGIGYSSLAYGVGTQPSCSGYYSVKNAYPSGSNGCSLFTSALFRK
jgi:hypothetical protein